MISFGGLKLGILGGGQLGLMLSQAAMNYGLELFIMDPDPEASCSRYTPYFTQGSLTDEEAVYSFGTQLDIITIEIENVSVAALKRLEQEGKTIYPQPHVIELIQDKGLQKLFFAEHGIPSAPFVFIDTLEALKNYHSMLPAVMKLRRAGYDGRGVIKLDSITNLSNGFTNPSILEEKVEFAKEISVIVARNSAGQVETYDVVEMEFNPHANLVEFLLSPARISFESESIAKTLAEKIITQLQMTGILAVEMFLTEGGSVLVNEIAPRPHNSGHHTIEANYVSQYEQHLRAILDLQLGTPRARSNAVMVNLLGSKGFTGKAFYPGYELVSVIEGAYIHLYGKSETRLNRKMGHVTILDDDLDMAYKTAAYVQKTLFVRGEKEVAE